MLSCTCCCSCLRKDERAMAAMHYPAGSALPWQQQLSRQLPWALPQPEESPQLCFWFACPWLMSILPMTDFPKATQRWRLHPNFKSQYSSLTTSLSSLAPFSSTYCLSLSSQIQCLTRKGFLFPSSKLLMFSYCFQTRDVLK